MSIFLIQHTYYNCLKEKKKHLQSLLVNVQVIALQEDL